MNKNQEDVLYLVYCALNDIVPNVHDIDIREISRISKGHSISSLVCSSLEKAGIKDEVLIDLKNKAIRKQMLFDRERSIIFSKLNGNGIWYLPLKGVILKDLYPIYGTRQMADNDILFDSNYRKEVKEIFQSLGYSTEIFDKSNHDVYHKDPVYNFEMHVSLFNKSLPVFYNYYNKLEYKYQYKGNTYERYMTKEDAYIYILAHAYKHFSNSGTGIRTLIDLYVYNSSYDLNRNYIDEECKKLGIDDFEKKTRIVGHKLFDKDRSNLNGDEIDFVDYFFSSCTYGTNNIRIENEINKLKLEGHKYPRAYYVFRRAFPKFSWFRQYYEFLDKYPIFIPFFSLYRFVKGMVSRVNTWSHEIRIIKRK